VGPDTVRKVGFFDWVTPGFTSRFYGRRWQGNVLVEQLPPSLVTSQCWNAGQWLSILLCPDMPFLCTCDSETGCNRKRRPVENVPWLKGGFSLCTLLFDTAASVSKSGWSLFQGRDAGFTASIIVARMGGDNCRKNCGSGWTVWLVFGTKPSNPITTSYACVYKYLLTSREHPECGWTFWSSLLALIFGTIGTADAWFEACAACSASSDNPKRR
jgi:hypothetical protein